MREVIGLGLAEKSNRRRPITKTSGIIGRLSRRWRCSTSGFEKVQGGSRYAGRPRNPARWSTAPAFAAALPKILQAEPKLLKAAMRAAFVSCLWRWHSYDEDEAEQQRFKAERVEVIKEAVTAEIAG